MLKSHDVMLKGFFNSSLFLLPVKGNFIMWSSESQLKISRSERHYNSLSIFLLFQDKYLERK